MMGHYPAGMIGRDKMPEKNEIPVGKPEDTKETPSDKAGAAWKGVAGILGMQEDWEARDKARAEQYAQELAHVQKHRDNLEKLQADHNDLYKQDVEGAKAHREWIQKNDETRMDLVTREVNALEKIAQYLDHMSDKA